ncbi:MAG: hypothetical protein MHM6MM_005529 [Cercozoa sp. M6MM]
MGQKSSRPSSERPGAQAPVAEQEDEKASLRSLVRERQSRRAEEAISSVPGEWWTEVQRLADESPLAVADVAALLPQFRELAAESAENPSTIEFSQFRDALSHNGINVSADDVVLRRLFHRFDLNRDGQLDFRQFTLGLCALSKGNLRDKVELMFSLYDLDDSGQISRGEMCRVLEQLDEEAQALAAIDAATAADLRQERHAAIGEFVDKMFDKYDRDRSGHLSFAQFLRAVCNHPVLVQLYEQRPNDTSLDDLRAASQ